MNMLSKIVINIYNLLTGAKNPLVYRSLFFFLFVSPVIALALIHYADLDRESTKSILAKRRALSVLSAAIIQENLGNLVNLGIAYATRPRVIEYIEKGDWKRALHITTQALDFFPFFDRIVLFDPEGVIKADMPHATPSVIGQSRTDREWYNSVKGSWKPYISGAYIRSAEPKTAVVSVIVPIKTLTSMTKAGHSAGKGEQKVIGILQFQIKLDIFHHWINRVDIGPGGIIYIVDQFGRLVYHPRYTQERTLTDFSSVDIVARVLRGTAGSEVNYNPIEKEERLAAYEPVSSYGWGVVITQPTGLAFTEKNERLKNMLISYYIIIFLAGAMALLILYSMITHRKAEEALRESEEKFRTIFENSSSAMAIIEKDTTISMVNKEYCRISLYEAKDVIGKSWTTHIPPGDLERLKEYNRKRLLDPKSVPDHYEFTFYRKDNKIRHSLMSVAIIPTSQNIVCSFVDITERKQSETERERLITELQSAIEQIKTLRGIIPICASCKKIRDDEGYWQQVEAYVSMHTEAEFSHGICPDCIKELYPELFKKT